MEIGTPPGSRRLQEMLQAAVQSVQWTYSLFWQLCPRKGVLVWGDGYYNGAIKTRKTMQPAEATAEEAALQRSQQIRDLYETLLAGETLHQPPTKRACTALSPEDLTESEWFFLMCISFSFPLASGLPGKAYARRHHVWLSGANEVDSKTFSRAILAKSAKIQTVVCIPLLDGVLELGTTDKVHEDIGFIYHVKSFFNDHQHLSQPPTPKPALSEHSTSNPSSSSLPPTITTYTYAEEEEGEGEEDEDEGEEEEEEDDDEEETGRLSSGEPAVDAAEPKPRKLMQLDAMSEDGPFGSPEEVSNNPGSDFQMLAASGSATADATPWPGLPGQINRDALPPHTIEDGDSNYSQTVSTILQTRSQSLSSLAYVNYSSHQSSFARWMTKGSDVRNHAQRVENGASQCVLKYIIFTVPFLNTKHGGKSARPPPKSTSPNIAEVQLRGTEMVAQDELNANHVVAERRRREKLNERFITLRSMVPFVTKMDKISILGDTIEYVKELLKRIQDMEARNCQIEIEKHQQKRMRLNHRARTLEAKGRGGETAEVEVSIIESDVLLEMRCEQREDLLIDMLQVLRDMRIETTAVQTSVNDGVFTAEIRAKVKGNSRGKKVSIVEVKRAIHRIIP